MKVKTFVALLIAMLFSSCEVFFGGLDLLFGSTPQNLPYWQEEKFFEDKSTGISKLIKTDGYWLCEDSVHLSIFYGDALVFYDDGTMGDFLFRRGKGDKGVVDLPRGTSDVDLKSALTGNGYWCFGGCYDCHDDTIRADTYSIHPYWWNLRKLRFTVVSRDTIEIVSMKDYSSEHISEWKTDSLRYTFVPTSSLPDPDDISIKKKKWIWRDEKDWKAYKKRMSDKHK
jgi:hypothetical protein